MEPGVQNSCEAYIVLIPRRRASEMYARIAFFRERGNIIVTSSRYEKSNIRGSWVWGEKKRIILEKWLATPPQLPPKRPASRQCPYLYCVVRSCAYSVPIGGRSPRSACGCD